MVAKIRQHVIVVIIVALICALASRPAAQSAIPAPPLDGLEPLVAAQLREVRQQLDSTVTRDATDPKKLADAYGSVAQVYHAYEFFDAAEAAYRCHSFCTA
jgi:hypothetical protein